MSSYGGSTTMTSKKRIVDLGKTKRIDKPDVESIISTRSKSKSRPKLTDKTLDMIKNLKFEKDFGLDTIEEDDATSSGFNLSTQRRSKKRLAPGDKAQVQSTQVDTSVSAKEKFESLLAPQDQLDLPLPYHFKRLLDRASQMDVCLVYFKRQSITPRFPVLKESMERTTKKRFTIDEVKKICRVKEDQFEVTYDRNQRVFLINMPKDFFFDNPDFDHRKQTLKQELQKITRVLHDAFLIDYYKKHPNEEEFNLQQAGQWHHAFDLHSVPDIEPLEFETQEAVRKTQSVADYVKDAQEKRKTMTMEILKNSTQNQSLIQNSEEQKELNELSRKSGLTVSTLKLIREKQEQQKVMTTIDKKGQDDSKQKNQAEELRRLANCLKQYMMAQQKYTVKMAQVLPHLQKKDGNIYKTSEQVMAGIKDLVKVVPEWCLLVNTKQGQFVKVLDPWAAMSSVYKKIKEWSQI